MAKSDKQKALDAVMKATGQTAEEVLRTNPSLADDLPDSAARRPPRGPGASAPLPATNKACTTTSIFG